jgi:CHAT domain-containing protein
MREDRRYVGFVIRKGGTLVRLDLGETEPIDAAIREFLRVIDAPTDDYKDPARRLATLFRDPIRPQLECSKGLILAGDGMLHRLPIAALPGTKEGTFWIEELALATVPAAQSLVVRTGERPHSSGALIVGDVDYGSLAGYAELPQTRGEAEDVAELFRTAFPSESVSLLMRALANEPSVCSQIASKRIVHMATHGYFNVGARAASSSEAFGALAQLDSGIVLARKAAKPSIDSDDDQRLSADELRRLDLRGVELVVLSACSSGLGHISSGQGVVGLVGALDRAGVGSVVCSLWKVDDSATAALMRSFYGHLWSDKPRIGPAQALRAAQLEMIGGTPGVVKPAPFAHPKYWAAFFVSGTPEAQRR